MPNFKNMTFKEFKEYADKEYGVKHKQTGKVYYVYWVTDKKDGVHYIGRRGTSMTDLQCDFFKYGTSSKRKARILSNPSDFIVTILRSFDNEGDASIYESYLHEKFEVEKNPCFWNESRQGITRATFFNTQKGSTTLYDKVEGKFRKVSKEEYSENKERYISHYKGVLWVIDKKTGEYIKVTREEYSQNKDKYLKNSTGKIVATDLVTGERTLFPKEEVLKNPERYKKAGSGTLTAIKRDTGEYVRIPVSEYDKKIYKIKSEEELYGTDLKTGKTLKLSKKEYYEKKARGEITSAATYHRKFVKVFDTIKKEYARLPIKEWEDNKERYKYHSSKESWEFLGKKREAVIKIPVYEISTGRRITISPEEYRSHKEKYIHARSKEGKEKFGGKND